MRTLLKIFENIAPKCETFRPLSREIDGSLPLVKEMTNPIEQAGKVVKYKFPKDINTILTEAEYQDALEAFKMELLKSGFKERIVDSYERFISKETILSQRKFFQILKNSKLNFNTGDILSGIQPINLENIEFRKMALDMLTKKSYMQVDDIHSILFNINTEEQLKCLEALLGNKNIPISMIDGLMEKAQTTPFNIILEELKTNPAICAIKSIRESSFSLVPKGLNPTKLNPLNIDENALALVHMTRYEPIGGEILSQRDKFMKLEGIGNARSSTHYTLNHAVQQHYGNCWDKFPLAIIMPYTSAVKANKAGKFVEGLANDLWTNGSVKIPEGSVIVKHNPELKIGEIKHYAHKEINGVTVIETSAYPHQVTPAVLEKMGYSHCPTIEKTGLGTFVTGESHGNSVEDITRAYKAWTDFAKTQGIKPILNDVTPSRLAERLIYNLNVYRYSNTWGENSKYTKSVIKKVIESIREGEKNGYRVGLDVNKLEDIFINAKTPNEAFKRLETELKIKPDCTLEELKQKYQHDEKMALDELLHCVRACNKAQKIFSAQMIDTEFIRKDLTY